MGPSNTDQHRVYTVSELTDKIKALLEESFPFIWIVGEISNFRTPLSGHFYFSLKDADAQISAVMFRGQQRQLKFEPEDGMRVTGMGRLSVYEPRGSYQIILEYMEPSGIGALQIAFEKLKSRLAQEGLFDDQHKQPIPFLPQKIALITSPSGAVVHDILNILERRYVNVDIQILPVKVQGDGAEDEIAAALDLLNQQAGFDAAILARGGGSLEDLQAFNSEAVARAIYACNVPLISAVGHETDYTIADFVADVRAPTPSGAAEIVVPDRDDWLRAINSTCPPTASGSSRVCHPSSSHSLGRAELCESRSSNCRSDTRTTPIRSRMVSVSCTWARSRTCPATSPWSPAMGWSTGDITPRTSASQRKTSYEGQHRWQGGCEPLARGLRRGRRRG